MGANLTRRLVRDGHEVHLLVRPEHQIWRMTGIEDEVRLHEGRVEDREKVRAVVRSVCPDWVFHLAAHGAYPAQTGIEQMTATNFMGCVYLLDACVETGMDAFVQAGSSSEYGLKDHAAAEDERLEPNSHYAITKAAATHYCRHAAVHRNIHAVTARLYSIYGPYEEPTRLIPNLVVRGLKGDLPPLTSPRTARDFVYVDDATEALIRIASATRVARGAVFNIASGVQRSLEEVVLVARRLMAITAEPEWQSMAPRSWDTDVWCGSPALLEREVGWRCDIAMEEGLRRTIRWLEADPAMLRHYVARTLCGGMPRQATGGVEDASRGV